MSFSGQGLTKEKKCEVSKELERIWRQVEKDEVLSNLPISKDCCSENRIMSFLEKQRNSLLLVTLQNSRAELS